MHHDETCSFYSTEPDVLQAENGSDEAEARMLEEVESSVGREGVVRLVTEGGAVGRGLDAGVGDVQVNVHIQLDPVVTPVNSLRIDFWDWAKFSYDMFVP